MRQFNFTILFAIRKGEFRNPSSFMTKTVETFTPKINLSSRLFELQHFQCYDRKLSQCQKYFSNYFYKNIFVIEDSFFYLTENRGTCDQKFKIKCIKFVSGHTHLLLEFKMHNFCKIFYQIMPLLFSIRPFQIESIMLIIMMITVFLEKDH